MPLPYDASTHKYKFEVHKHMITSSLHSTSKAHAASGVSKTPVAQTTAATLSELREELRGLSGDELKATSVVEFTGQGQNKEYVKFILCTDETKPRCLNEPLPMNNGAVKTMVGALVKQYGDKALKKELSFLGGPPSPGFTQVTLAGTGLGLYFNTETGKPMGKLEGSL